MDKVPEDYTQDSKEHDQDSGIAQDIGNLSSDHQDVKGGFSYHTG